MSSNIELVVHSECGFTKISNILIPFDCSVWVDRPKLGAHEVDGAVSADTWGGKNLLIANVRLPLQSPVRGDGIKITIADREIDGSILTDRHGAKT